MKTIIIYISVLLSASLLFSQSSIIYDAGTHIDVGTGADVCAATITVNGSYSGSGTFCNNPVDVEVEEDLLTPKEYSLSQNYPNPFNPSTVIKYQLPISTQVTLKVFDILGDEIATLVNEEKPSGYYEAKLDASQLSSGVYLYRLQAGSFVETKKMLVLK